MNKILLSDVDQPSRKTTRLSEFQQANFAEIFDGETFIYDVFHDTHKTYVIAPPSPIETWNDFLNSAKFDGLNFQEISHSFFRNKIHKIIINSVINEISWKSKIFKCRPLHKLRAINNAVYTLQKNNDLIWIKDWANWYVSHHKVNAVIIYDNASDAYDINQIKRELANINAQIIVEPSLFKYGPGSYKGSEWDSDFLQYAMLEHVRYFYMGGGGYLINSDIDELLVTKDCQPISSFFHNEVNCISYHGKWVHLDLCVSNDTPVTHKSHTVLDPGSGCPAKWTANLSLLLDDSFLRVHDIQGEGCRILQTDDAIYLHHKQISTNWKGGRREKDPYSKSFVSYENIRRFFK